MGGDGGTKAVHRAYLRGAGSASTTGDHQSNNNRNQNSDKHISDQEASRAMQYCYISDQPLQYDDSSTLSSSSPPSSKIVTCRYGRLYNKEAAVEALLHRKQMSKSSTTMTNATNTTNNGNRLGLHIRGLKDLYNIRFQTIRNHDETNNSTAQMTPVCPITDRVLNGRIVAYALIPGHVETMANVVSEYALKQSTSEQDIMTEYGATKKIRLLLPPSLYDTIDQEFIKEKEESTTGSCNSRKKRKLKHEKRVLSAEETMEIREK